MWRKIFFLFSRKISDIMQKSKKGWSLTHQLDKSIFITLFYHSNTQIILNYMWGNSSILILISIKNYMCLIDKLSTFSLYKKSKVSFKLSIRECCQESISLLWGGKWKKGFKVSPSPQVYMCIKAKIAQFSWCHDFPVFMQQRDVALELEYPWPKRIRLEKNNKK